MTLTEPEAAPTSAPPDAAAPHTRGKLTISEQAIGKIAAQSASEVASAGGRSGGLLGIGQHSDLSARPKVEVELRETTANLFIAVSVPWGRSIRQTTQQVRERVSRRVQELTGVVVHRVDVDVATVVLTDPTQDEGILR